VQFLHIIWKKLLFFLNWHWRYTNDL